MDSPVESEEDPTERLPFFPARPRRAGGEAQRAELTAIAALGARPETDGPTADGEEADPAFTGASDPLFALVSTLYHALRQAAAAVKSIDDATRAGDAELARFFDEVHGECRGRAERAKALLARRLGQPFAGPR